MFFHVNTRKGCVVLTNSSVKHSFNARVTEHFSSQFSDPSVDGLNAFPETLSRLTHRITPAEINRAIGKLNNGRASGHDDIPAE